MFMDKDIDILREILETIKIESDKGWAIYGTGNGADLIYDILDHLSAVDRVQSIIERDEKVYPNQKFHDIPVKRLSQVCDSIEGIIIAAVNHHEIIYRRIQKSLTREQLAHIQIIDIFGDVVKEDRIRYLKYIEKGILKESGEFVEFDEKGYQPGERDTKIIAWYLPQFHQIEINNKFHGQGFTEWTNTSRAIPLFTGHYQPHIPYDVGYYDLLNPTALKRQVYLAKHYGIYGFCFHYYWFSGKRLMEKPLEMFLAHKELDMPFCLDWATENWTALWDGGEQEIMLEQRLETGDDQRFMEDILPYMRDSRYIKIDGKPVLVIYRINMFEKECAKRLLHSFRKIAKKNGFPDLYIMLANGFIYEGDVMEWGADAVVEFPPHRVFDSAERYIPLGYLNPYYNGRIYNVLPIIKDKKYMLDHGGQAYFRSALTSWDSTARKATSKGSIYVGLDPGTFKEWLADIVIESKKIHSGPEDIVFVNSWNEWAEGSHLEPDMKYGYAYLQAVKEVLEEQRQ